MSDFFSRIDAEPAAGMEPSDFTDANAFTTDDTTELNRFYYTNEDDKIYTGVWQSAPCREEIEAYPAHEMMTVLAGSVTVTGADGRSETYTTGDTFFIAKGTPVTWEITETLRKFYMIAE